MRRLLPLLAAFAVFALSAASLSAQRAAAGEKIHGTLTATGEIWLDVTPDGQKAATRCYLVPPGGRLDANGVKFVHGLKVGSEIEVTCYWFGATRMVSNVNIGPSADTDAFVGTVTDKTPADKVSKTLPYLEVRDDGGKAQRFSPHWTSTGIDKDMLATLMQRNPGDRVEVHSVMDDHLRAHTFRVLSIAPELLAQPSEKYGVITGVVADKGKDWISVKPESGDVERLTPQRIVGAKDQLDRDVLATIAAAKPGERVEAGWILDGQRRIFSLIRIPPALTPAQEKSMQVSMPVQATGFKGTLLVQLVKPVANACFTVKVERVVSFAEGNRTKLNPAALSEAWKGAFAWCGPAKNAASLPELKVGDFIDLDCYQNEMHLRYSKAAKVHDPATVPSN